MAMIIQHMRFLLRNKLEQGLRDKTNFYFENDNNRTWDHITEQKGMFCYSGLSVEEIDKLREKYHIYITSDGRINVAV